MALDKATLTQAIQNAFDAESDKQVNPAEARARQAQAIANAIDAFVKSGTVTVNVTGTCPNGGVTGTGTGGIS